MKPTTFKEHELAGWSAKAGAYDDYFGAVTARIAPALLDDAKVTKGSLHLDIACGPGYVAGGGAQRGAQATGIDFPRTISSSSLAELLTRFAWRSRERAARGRVPSLRGRQQCP